MKALRKFLDDNVKPHFEKGGKFEKLHVVYDGMDTFLFTPAEVTKNGTHIRDTIDLKRTMILVVLALVPCLLFGIWNTGHQHFLAIGEYTGLGDGFWEKVIYGLWIVLPIVIVSYGTGLALEFLFAGLRGHAINEGFLVSGMLIPLIMPADVPLWMVALSTAFAVVIGKEVFGGTGMNILNPALTARAFLFFAYPTKMSGNEVWIPTEGEATVDGFTGETLMAQSTSMSSGFYDAAGNQFGSVWDTINAAFWGWIPGSIGETSVVACLLGAALLLFTGIGSWRIMLSFFLGGVAMSLLFNLWGANEYMLVHPLQHLVMGGFMFGLVYMATDPVTASQTPTGKWIYGFFAGFLAIMIRVFNPAFPEGVMMAILFMNVMAPLIDHYVVEANIKRRQRRTAKVTTA